MDSEFNMWHSTDKRMWVEYSDAEVKDMGIHPPLESFMLFNPKTKERKLIKRREFVI